MFLGTVQKKEEGGHGHIVAVVFAAVVVVSIAVVAWFYHRRRVADLKSEIAQVHYTSEPLPSPGKSFLHFFLQFGDL